MPQPRLAVRAIILRDNRLLLVNAFSGRPGFLWCAPGGGAETGQSLPENLIREVREETGLTITVGALAAVREFKRDDDSFHQVEVFFHATPEPGEISPDWTDPEGVVTERRFFTQEEVAALPVQPQFLATLPFDPEAAAYHQIVRMVE